MLKKQPYLLSLLVMDIFTFPIRWMLENFGLFMLLLAIVFMVIHCLCYRRFCYKVMYQYLALLPLGATSIYAFIFHAFFPLVSATSIGWENSPFQFEVAVANLAIGVIAILSVYQTNGFRLATVIASTCWLWGDAVGHLYQILVHHNLAIGNAGSWFYLDFLLPVLFILSFIKMQKLPNEV